METLGVLLVHPIMPYMQEELNKRFKLFKYWEAPNRKQFLAQNCDAIKAVVGNTVIGADSELIEYLPNLEIVSTFSVGLDKVDLVKCRERGIKVTNTPDVLTDDVADLAIGLILATLRRLCASDRYVRNGLWKSKGDFRLTTKFSGKSLGQGRIRSAIAKRAEAFVCPLSYHSKSEKLNSKITYYSNITDLAANSQILVVACRLTQETHCIINCTVMEVLGPKGVLVHIGHGSIVYGPELVSALRDGLLGGVGLDAFEHKPGPPGEFFRLDNVVLLPHVGSHMWDTGKDMTDLVVRNLEVYALNKSPLTPVLRGARAKGIR